MAAAEDATEWVKTGPEDTFMAAETLDTLDTLDPLTNSVSLAGMPGCGCKDMAAGMPWKSSTTGQAVQSARWAAIAQNGK
jgi:hypothetical protein